MEASIMRVAFAAVMSEEGAKAFERFMSELHSEPEGEEQPKETAGDREFKRRSRRLDPDKLPPKPTPNPAIAAALAEAGRLE